MHKSNVTLIGSYKKDPEKLAIIYNQLIKKHKVLSPASIEFVENKSGFVKTTDELAYTVKELEEQHLRSINDSDFVVLHAPDGYVGISGAFELGYAYSLGIPIISDEKPKDSMLKKMVTLTLHDAKGLKRLSMDTGKGIDMLQRYYKRTAKRRGWDKEDAKDTMLLLTEEVGELARAIRKLLGLKRANKSTRTSLADELADVQLYLVHLANILNINLSEAVTSKENKNSKRRVN